MGAVPELHEASLKALERQASAGFDASWVPRRYFQEEPRGMRSVACAELARAKESEAMNGANCSLAGISI